MGYLIKRFKTKKSASQFANRRNKKSEVYRYHVTKKGFFGKKWLVYKD